MKFAVALPLLVSLTSVSIAAGADGPHFFAEGPTTHSAGAKVKAHGVGGVETIKPREPSSKDRKNGSGWNGAYVGVNAGAGFGGTAGTNIILPFGASGQTEK